MKPDFKVKRRIKQQDMQLIHSAEWSRVWHVRTTYPLKECLNSDFFASAPRGYFAALDIVHLSRCTDDQWKRAIEHCPHIIIREIDNLGVTFSQPFPIDSQDEPGEEGIVVTRGWAGQFAIRVDGTVHAARNTLVEANEYATLLGHDIGKPVKLLDLKAPKKAA